MIKDGAIVNIPQIRRKFIHIKHIWTISGYLIKKHMEYFSNITTFLHDLLISDKMGGKLM